MRGTHFSLGVCTRALEVRHHRDTCTLFQAVTALCYFYFQKLLKGATLLSKRTMSATGSTDDDKHRTDCSSPVSAHNEWDPLEVFCACYYLF